MGTYGYQTNNEFIDKTQKLLERLEKKKLWNKDTLIIGLDKSVRPLAYTMKKLSDLEKKETPEIRFFNYSYYDYSKGPSHRETEEIIFSLKKMFDQKKISNYKKVLILDDHTFSGDSLKKAKEIMEEYFSGFKNKPKIYLAALTTMKSMEDMSGKVISSGDSGINKAMSYEMGIEDKHSKYVTREKNGPVQESIRISKKLDYLKFAQNRSELRSQIKKYVKGKEIKNSKQGNLEKKLMGLGAVAGFFFSLFFLSSNLTGNVIGNLDGDSNNFVGIMVFIASLFLTYFYLKKS